MAKISYKDLFKKINEYESQYKALRGAIADEYKAFFMYSTALVHCKNEIIKDEFFQHAQEEHEHALLFADILKELGSQFSIGYNIENINYMGDCKFVSPSWKDTVSIIKDNIDGENCAIQSYTDLLETYEWSDEHKRIIKSIISDEEQHIEDLKKLRKKVEAEIDDKEEANNHIFHVY